MKNLTIGKQINLGFAALLLILLILGIISILQMSASRNRSSLLSREVAPFTVRVGNLVIYLDEFRLNERVFGITGSDENLKKAQDTQKKAEDFFQEISKTVSNSEWLSDAEKIQQRLQKLIDQYSQIVGQASTSWNRIAGLQRDLLQKAEETISETNQL
ncbi:MAG: MCP four helix bundle domain-containing protein, partial [Chthoniobacterales bacterium]|nr:MCP four helix bundle domain-containing protein [Chthoniobacterales bacterium]